MCGVFPLFQYPYTVLISTVMLAITVAVARQPLTCLTCETFWALELSSDNKTSVYIITLKI